MECMLFLLCNLLLVICHDDFVLPDGLPRDDVDVGCSTFVVAAANSPHILGHLLIRLVLHVSHLRRIVPPPCLLVLPYTQQLLHHMTSIQGDSLSIIGPNTSVSKSNRLHVVIFRCFFIDLRYIP